ncbi:MAG: class GN sortase [Rhodospirillaceae bacterium]
MRLLPASVPTGSRSGSRTWLRPAAVLLAAAGLGVFLWGAYIPVKAWAAHVLLQDAWDRAAGGDERAKPWPWADTRPVAKIWVERLGQSNIVLAGAQGRTLAFGPGHLDGTALPGAPGHSVISAHRGTHFRWLEKAQVGDLIETERPDGARGPYRIVEKRIIDSREEQIAVHPDRDLLTLITCSPWRTGTRAAPCG